MKQEEIKFRQENNGQRPKGWHYWGFIDGVFISPFTSIAGGKSYQFTGFKTFKGIEIYEGDILSGDYPDEVYWNNERGQWMLRNSENPDDILWEILQDNKVKIIGNTSRIKT